MKLMSKFFLSPILPDKVFGIINRNIPVFIENDMS